VKRALAAAALLAATPARADEPPAAPKEDAEPDEIVPDKKARRMAAEANLEPTRRREGLAIGFGLGPSMQIGFGIEEASGTGGSFNLRIGTSASDRIAWFVDLFAAGTPREGDTGMNKLNQSTNLTAGAQLFLLETLWLRAGLGLGQLDLRSEEGGTDARSHHTGLGMIGGGGIDFLRRGRFALSGDLTFVSGVYKDGFVSAAVFQLGFTWY
jgi:hypothetical protein